MISELVAEIKPRYVLDGDKKDSMYDYNKG